MRFWFSGPRILGIRPGVSFGPGGWQRAQSAGQRASVYVIQGDHGLVKIGISTNVQARLTTLQTSSPFPLRLVFSTVCADALMAEQEAHAALAPYRISGEWFDVPAHMAIAAVQQAAGPVIDHDADGEAAIWFSVFWRLIVVTTAIWVAINADSFHAAFYLWALGMPLAFLSMWRRLKSMPQISGVTGKIMAIAVISVIISSPLSGIIAKFIADPPIP